MQILHATTGFTADACRHNPEHCISDVTTTSVLVVVCRPVTLEANQVWARWSGQGLCMELQAALESDAAFSSPIALQAWEETVIAQVRPSNSLC